MVLFFSTFTFAHVCAPFFPHTHRALPSASIGSDRFRAACLPPRFSYHYCLRSLIMHRSGSVHLLCVSRLPPLPSRGSYGSSNHFVHTTTVHCRMSNGRTVVVGQCLCRTKMDGFRFFPGFFFVVVWVRSSPSEFIHYFARCLLLKIFCCCCFCCLCCCCCCCFCNNPIRVRVLRVALYSFHCVSVLYKLESGWQFCLFQFVCFINFKICNKFSII